MKKKLLILIALIVIVVVALILFLSKTQNGDRQSNRDYDQVKIENIDSTINLT